MVRKALAIVTAVVLVATGAACGSGSSKSPSASAPGVTAAEVLVGTHQPLTGPAAAGYSKISAATKAYFDYVNANGGVNGRKINPKILAGGSNPADNPQGVRQPGRQDHEVAILGGRGTPAHTG